MTTTAANNGTGRCNVRFFPCKRLSVNFATAARGLPKRRLSMDDKKPYSPPQLFRVELNQEQAILSACSIMAMTPADNGGNGCRQSAPFCKNTGANLHDSGMRLS